MLDLVSRVRAYCEEHNLLEYEALVIGVSGGPDSVALLKIISQIYEGKILAVHVNHNLRPGDCDEDSNLTKAFCQNLNIPLEVYSYDVEGYSINNKKSLEEAGRILRYQSFEDAGNKHFPDKNYAICVAHHSGDLSETMLMNLFRGSGLEGLVSPKSKSGNVIRPLLTCSKDELISYLEENDIQYAIDKTNLENDHTRNIWRNEIIPQIKKVSIKEPQKALADTYNHLSTDLDFIEVEAGKLYNTALINGQFLKVDLLKNAHKALSSRALRHLWKDTFGNLTDFESVNLDSALDAVMSGKCKIISMPFDRNFFVAAGLCGFANTEDTENQLDKISEELNLFLSDEKVNLEINNGFAFKIPNSGILIETEIIENEGELAYNKFSWFLPVLRASDLTLMNNLGGLKFKKAGSSGHKEVRRIFTDLKIPECSREKILGIVRDGEVLFIPGIGHAEGFTNPSSWERYISENGNDGPFLKIEFGGC